MSGTCMSGTRMSGTRALKIQHFALDPMFIHILITYKTITRPSSAPTTCRLTSNFAASNITFEMFREHLVAEFQDYISSCKVNKGLQACK